NEQEVSEAWLASMQDVLGVQDQASIPELNIYQCGSYTEHSLEDAHEIAKNVIARGIGVNKNEDLSLDNS
ncbi:S-ribosylhomocysteine lyase, partial [Streptococcus pneumoniae]